MGSDKIIIAYPTDTVWGLGCRIDWADGHKQVMNLKGSSINKPVSVLFHSLEQLSSYIDLPEEFDNQWLKKFFSLETTLCLATSRIIDEKIPGYIYQNSEYVGVRFLELDFLKEMPSPIITTSLNLVGEQSILNYPDALAFCSKLNECVEILTSSRAVAPSGNASTIVAYNEKMKSFTILRAGALIDQVRKHCRL